jgi:heme-degrading monooxygenase HmoA
LEEDVEALILLNKFTVDLFLKVFAATTAIMKHQSGFISAQLHRGIADSRVFFIYVVWESTEHFKRAFNSPQFRPSVADLPLVR